MAKTEVNTNVFLGGTAAGAVAMAVYGVLVLDGVMRFALIGAALFAVGLAAVLAKTAFAAG